MSSNISLERPLTSRHKRPNEKLGNVKKRLNSNVKGLNKKPSIKPNETKKSDRKFSKR